MPSLFDDPVFNQRVFFPRADSTPCPAGAEDLSLPVAPGVALHARWHPSASARATFVVFHGNGEIVADYDEQAQRYHHDVGADLVAVDFRGYGRSGGVPNYRDVIADSVPVIEQLRSALSGKLRGPLVALGRSLGGGCSAELAWQEPRVVDAIVMESAAADPVGVLKRRNLAPADPLSEQEIQTFDPRFKLARCWLPVLVLHGAKDKTIHPREARANFEAVEHRTKRLVLVPKRGHNDVMRDDAYWRALAEFVSLLPRATRWPQTPANSVG